MRRLARIILLRPVLWFASKFSSKPDRVRIFGALDSLLKEIEEGQQKKGLVIPFDARTGKFIIFSDQHKGARDGADDFKNCEVNYLAALTHYHNNGFYFISLGDSEELWENLLPAVKKHNKENFEKEKAFVHRQAFIKIFGNHDLFWDNDPFAAMQLKSIYDTDIPIYEGVLLTTKTGGKDVRIFCTHGHQGDKQSDGNWFSKFFVARIWAPLQAYLRINPNTPAYDASLKTEHNNIMYHWSSAQKDTVLVTGHTHQPVFESLTHLERLYRDLLLAREKGDTDQVTVIQEEIARRKQSYDIVNEHYRTMKPSYFNSGCCCFSDGDITGIEIEEGQIRLVKWQTKGGQGPTRMILEDAGFDEIFNG